MRRSIQREKPTKPGFNKHRKEGSIMLKIRRAQSVLEYAILMVIIIAALLTLQTYIKRGIQGRLKSATDDIGDQYTGATGANYYKRVTTCSKTTEKTQAGTTSTELRADTVTNTYRYIKTDENAMSGEYWSGPGDGHQ